MPRKVFEPVMIGKLKIKNRLCTLPMVQNFADTNGYATPRLIETYRRRAEGGFGLVHTEASFIRNDGNCFLGMLGVHSDDGIPWLREVADAIHEGGARACIQPMHGGRQAPRLVTGTQPLAPSALHPWNEASRPLTTKECEDLIICFAEAAARAKYCGFDTVLIHAAHGFLLTSFMSPWTNQGRADRFADPTVFISEVIKKVKEFCGADFPVMVRIDVDEFVGSEGITPELNKKLVPAMDKAGADGYDLTNSNFDTLEYNLEPIYWTRGGRVDQLLSVRSLTQKTLSVRGRITDPILVQKIIEDGNADMVGVGRAMLSDPDFARKMQEGRYDDVRKCIACDWSCAWKLFEQVPIKCSINYNYGKEYMEPWGPPPAKSPKKVLVVGGGPGGMECARVLAERGHKATLYEKKGELGGMVLTGAATPRLNTSDLMNIVEWLPRELKKLGVEIHLNKEITVKDIEAMKPDAVVLATGATFTVPDIPGIHLEHVLSLDDYFFEKKPVGNRVVVLGGQEGSEAAVSLAREGKEVTLVSETATYADANYMYVLRLKCVSQYLAEGKVRIITEAKIAEITQHAVRIVHKDGKHESLPIDTVVYAVGRTPNRTLEDALQGKPHVYAIGDCVDPTRIHEAMHMANAVARQIN